MIKLVFFGARKRGEALFYKISAPKDLRRETYLQYTIRDGNLN